jgi:hypothetical protein
MATNILIAKFRLFRFIIQYVIVEEEDTIGNTVLRTTPAEAP